MGEWGNVGGVLGDVINGGEDSWNSFTGKSAAEAAAKAAEYQLEGISATLEQQQQQWDKAQEWMAPYMDAGEKGLEGMMALAGLGGPEAEAALMAQIEGSSAYQSKVQAGENAMLQNASATGGMRGGNTQGALAQFRPSMLNAEIESRYNKLAGLTGIGQATAVGGVAAGNQVSQMQTNTMREGGDARANEVLTASQAKTTGTNNMMKFAAMYMMS